MPIGVFVQGLIQTSTPPTVFLRLGPQTSPEVVTWTLQMQVGTSKRRQSEILRI